MRLNRGSGVGGLAGIRARNGVVLRPLLGWTRAALHAVVDAAGVTPVDDPSNGDDRYDRVRMRRALAGQDWLDPLAATASARHLAAAEAALSWATDQLRTQRVAVDADGMTIDLADVPPELAHRLLQHAIEEVGEKPVRGGDVERLMADLAAGGGATLGGAQVRVDAAKPYLWQIRLAPPRTG
jgi:tRNA(Ile)-lysidine synthase